MLNPGPDHFLRMISELAFHKKKAILYILVLFSDTGPDGSAVLTPDNITVFLGCDTM
jgi:hypothetical protein